MSDERPSDALQPAPKKRMGEGQGRREDPEDDGPSHDPGTWAAASDAARERRRVHVRRGGNASGAGTDQQALAATLPGEAQAHASAANAFSGVDLIAAPQASTNPFANVSLTAPSTPSIPFAGVQLTPPLASAEDKQQEIPEAEGKAGAQPDAPLAASADTTVEAAEAASNTTPPAEAHGTEVAPAPAASTTAKDKGESKAEAAPAPATSATAPGTNANIFGSAYSAGAFGGFGTSAAGSGSGGFGGLSSGGFGGFGAAAAASGGAGAGGFGGLGGFQAGFGGFGTTGSGFGFNAGASTGSNSSPPGGLHVPAAQAEENENPEAECEAAFKPVCELPPPPEKKVTGEEDETTEFSVNGKLYEFDAPKQQWRERGTGEFKINVGSRGARLVMRATGNLRLLLNAKLYAGMPTQPMSGQVGVTFACINAAAPSDPSASEASKALDTGASSGGAASADVPGSASKQAPVTYAVRLKSPERMTALLEALEKAKAEHCAPSASAKGNGGDVEAGVF